MDTQEISFDHKHRRALLAISCILICMLLAGLVNAIIDRRSPATPDGSALTGSSALSDSVAISEVEIPERDVSVDANLSNLHSTGFLLAALPDLPPSDTSVGVWEQELLETARSLNRFVIQDETSGKPVGTLSVLLYGTGVLSEDEVSHTLTLNSLDSGFTSSDTPQLRRLAHGTLRTMYDSGGDANAWWIDNEITALVRVFVTAPLVSQAAYSDLTGTIDLHLGSILSDQ